MYWYVPVFRSDLVEQELTWGESFQLILAHCSSSLRLQYVQVWTSTHFYLLVYTSIYYNELVWTSMYQYIMVHTSIYSNFQHSNALLSSKWIHHSTWQYKKVPKSPVPLNKAVHEGTRPCTFMYFLVQPYSGVHDFWVLPCTAMYYDVSTWGIARHFCVGN